MIDTVDKIIRGENNSLALRLIRLGFTTLVAGYLIYHIVGVQNGKLDAIIDSQNKLTNAMTSANIRMGGFSDLYSSNMDRLIAINRQMCVNSAKNEIQLAKCLEN